jgi:predicted transglutaminase-like protease
MVLTSSCRFLTLNELFKKISFTIAARNNSSMHIHNIIYISNYIYILDEQLLIFNSHYIYNIALS